MRKRRNRINIELGARLRQMREVRGMTQDKAAYKVGLKRCSLVNLEYGRQNINIDQLYRFASIYGISLGTLVEGL